MTSIGVYPDLSSEDYHAHKQSISRSALMDFDKSPYTYWAKHLNPDRPQKDATPQMQLGSAFHTLILEPHLFGEQYGVLPPKVLLKDVGREIYDRHKKNTENMETSGKIIISNEDMCTLRAMELKILSNEKAMQLIRDSRIENSYFWIDDESGLLIKSRPDILHPTIIVDLKTCADASERAIQNEVFRYGYDCQMAMIRNGVEKLEGNRISNFILLCVETKYPHNTAICILDEEIIDNAELKYKSLLLKLKDSLKTNEWLDHGVYRIGLPKWAIYD